MRLAADMPSSSSREKAIVYGSSPVEHAALQIRIWPLSPGHDGLSQEIEMSGFAKKGREIRGQRVEQGDQLFAGRVRDHMLVVLFEGPEFALADFLAQAGLNQLLLAVLEVDAASPVGQFGNLIEFALRQCFTRGSGFQRAPPRPE